MNENGLVMISLSPDKTIFDFVKIVSFLHVYGMIMKQIKHAYFHLKFSGFTINMK
jgi:hypothetical protein